MSQEPELDSKPATIKSTDDFVVSRAFKLLWRQFIKMFLDEHKWFFGRLNPNLIITGLILFCLLPFPIKELALLQIQGGLPDLQNPTPSPSQGSNIVFIPMVMDSTKQFSLPKVNVPFFDGVVAVNQTAIFWFGKVSPTSNYIDARLGYTTDYLYIHLSIVDRRLWCNENPTPGNLVDWDSVSLYLNTGGLQSTPQNNSIYQFIGQLGMYDCPDGKTVYRRESTGWQTTAIPFTLSTEWRGDAPNNDGDDRGWTITYKIPFTSLGLSTAPQSGSIWGVALRVHNRDSASDDNIPDQIWPDNSDPNLPSTWGRISFGLPTFTPPPATPVGSVTLRNLQNGVSVVDGSVGGGTICGDGLDFWNQWGDTSNPGSQENDYFNIQNQTDIADWPCFSKYYITFPLDSLPKGKVILSAVLTLNQFGNSGGGEWGQPPSSYIQVFTINKDWSESTLTWNNAPQMMENVSQAEVDPLPGFPGWPGISRTWDLSRAVANVYPSPAPLRLALYSADEDYHSGKYFYSSDAGIEARPTLKVIFGNP